MELIRFFAPRRTAEVERLDARADMLTERAKRGRAEASDAIDELLGELTRPKNGRGEH